MRAVLQVVECLGIRPSLPANPPRGTSSRLLQLRLQHSQPRIHQTRSFSRAQRQDNPSLNLTAPSALEPPAISPAEVDILRDAYLYTHPIRRYDLKNESDSSGTMHFSDDPDVRGLIATLKTGDSGELYTYLGHLTSTDKPSESLADAIAKLPATTFSELLRCLDPFALSKAINPADGIRISPALAQMTPLGRQVNNFGITIIFVELLRRLTIVWDLRKAAEKRPLFHDYLVMIRCAGAASDMMAAKRFWHEMEDDNFRVWRESAAYTEFVRARFLTEPLYMQHDPSRFRARPYDLMNALFTWHKGPGWTRRWHRIGRLERNLVRKRTHRFGQNPNVTGYIENMTRVLRKRKPIRKVQHTTIRLGADQDVNLVCASMVALGRTGAKRDVANLLKRYWGIRVWHIPGKGLLQVDGGIPLKADSPTYPTARLLSAIVHAFGCNSDIMIPLKLIEHVSKVYGILIPDQVWFDLLSWAYISASKSSAIPWRHVGYKHKVIGPDAVHKIWRAMTSEPYNVQPGFEQYDVMVNALIEQRRHDEAVALMRELRPHYDALVRAQEDALWNWAQAIRQGVPSHAARRRHERAHTRKWAAWHAYESWCWKMLKKARASPRNAADEMAARTIPKLVDEFGTFMPERVVYRTATGYVDLRRSGGGGGGGLDDVEAGTQPRRYRDVVRQVEVAAGDNWERYEHLGHDGRWSLRWSVRERWAERGAADEEAMDEQFVWFRAREAVVKKRRVRRPVTWEPSVEDVAAGRIGVRGRKWLVREFT